MISLEHDIDKANVCSDDNDDDDDTDARTGLFRLHFKDRFFSVLNKSVFRRSAAENRKQWLNKQKRGGGAKSLSLFRRTVIPRKTVYFLLRQEKINVSDFLSFCPCERQS